MDHDLRNAVIIVIVMIALLLAYLLHYLFTGTFNTMDEVVTSHYDKEFRMTHYAVLYNNQTYRLSMEESQRMNDDSSLRLITSVNLFGVEKREAKAH
jgi:hypothetical protein